MTPAEVLASWSGWGSTKEGDLVAADILAALAAHGFRVVGEGQAVIGGEVVTLRTSNATGGRARIILWAEVPL